MERPDYLLDIPADEYHRATKELKYLSSHRLHLFRRCPALYVKHARGEIVEGDTAAFVLGRATHKLIIEGPEAFDAEYAVSDGPTNPKTGAPYGKTTRVYLDWAETQKKPVVSGEDHALMTKMRGAVFGHGVASKLFSAGFAETTVRGAWNGVPTQIRPDWYDPERNLIIDLKTCQDVDRFKFDVRDYGYVFQLAFYAHEIAEKRADGKIPECWLVAVEKREPFRVAVYKLTEYTVDSANFEGTKEGPGNETVIYELKSCRANDVWPTRYESFGMI